MTNTTEETNKALVLEAFDTLFNKRDYVAAGKFWSPDYIQHSAHIPPGRDGLFNLVKAAPAAMRYENSLIMAEGDLLMLHGVSPTWASQQPGSLSISSVSRTADSRSTGMSSRTRPHARRRAAACQCLARSFPIRCAKMRNRSSRVHKPSRPASDSFKCLFMHCCLGIGFHASASCEKPGGIFNEGGYFLRRSVLD